LPLWWVAQPVRASRAVIASADIILVLIFMGNFLPAGAAGKWVN
jgi:hypothetical protein